MTPQWTPLYDTTMDTTVFMFFHVFALSQSPRAKYGVLDKKCQKKTQRNPENTVKTREWECPDPYHGVGAPVDRPPVPHYPGTPPPVHWPPRSLTHPCEACLRGRHPFTRLLWDTVNNLTYRTV